MLYLITVLIAIAWILAITGITVWISRTLYKVDVSFGNQLWFALGIVWILSRFINM